MVRDDVMGQFNSVHRRKGYIDECDIGAKLRHRRQGSDSVGSFTDHVESVCG
jgi:hypothetical protein